MAGTNGSDIHTVPHDGGWANKQKGEVVTVHRTKETAVETGRDLARTSRSEHFIHNKNGQIGERNSYGNDPKSSKG